MPRAYGGASDEDASAGGGAAESTWRRMGRRGGDCPGACGERLCAGRQVHRSCEVVAVDLQLPALFPARREGVGEDFSGGEVMRSTGTFSLLLVSIDR